MCFKINPHLHVTLLSCGFVSLSFLFRSRWIFSKAFDLFQSHQFPEDVVSRFWTNEYDCCEEVGRKHARNYFAWSYRIWVTRQLPGQILTELTWANSFLSRNVSDRSAAHYCEQVLTLCTDSTLMENLIVQQVEQGWRLIEALPGHEALWQHLRVLMRIYFDRIVSVESPLSVPANKMLEGLCGPVMSTITITAHDHSHWNILIGHVRHCHHFMQSKEADVPQRKHAATSLCDVYFVMLKELSYGLSRELQDALISSIRGLSADMQVDGTEGGEKHTSHFCEYSRHSALWKGLDGVLNDIESRLL